MKFKIFKFESVTSTNDVAINLIKEKKISNGCVYADIQTKGKGTKGKKWVSEIGNLFGSFFFPLKNPYPPFNEFFIINPVIISEILNKFCEKKIISFKWPNDILLNGKKVCGILQEVIIINGMKFLIIGIGINIISHPNLKNTYLASNILEETKKQPSTKEIMHLLKESYENFFDNLKEYSYINFKKKMEVISIK